MDRLGRPVALAVCVASSIFAGAVGEDASSTSAPSSLPTPAPTALPGTAGAAASGGGGSGDDDVLSSTSLVAICVGAVIFALSALLMFLFYKSSPPFAAGSKRVTRVSRPDSSPLERFRRNRALGSSRSRAERRASDGAGRAGEARDSGA